MTHSGKLPSSLSASPSPPGSKTAVAYEHYFRSGSYDSRYPRANPQVLECVRRHLPANGHIIDYGCGNGRYLFALRDEAAKIAGFDVSPAALELVANRARELGWNDLGILGPDPRALSRYTDKHGLADMVLCLFGVLGHMTARDQRRRALHHMMRSLKPGSGRIILSVPNRWRRFYFEQLSGCREGAISYLREMQGSPVEMEYQLFGPRRLRRELSEAGLQIQTLAAESFLSESMVARYRLARRIEHVFRPVLPAATGYGLLAVVGPKKSSHS